MNAVDPVKLAEAQATLAALTDVKPADFANQIADEVAGPGLDIAALVAAAREKLSLTPATVVKKQVEAPDRDTVNTLLATAADLKRRADALTAERAEITDLLADLLPDDAEELTVDKAVVFTKKVVVSRSLNTNHIKSLFPDIPENAEMYTEVTKVMRLYK